MTAVEESTRWRRAYLVTLAIDATTVGLLSAAASTIQLRSRRHLRGTAVGGWMLAALALGTVKLQRPSLGALRQARALLHLGALVNAGGSTYVARTATSRRARRLALALLVGGSGLSAVYLRLIRAAATPPARG